MTKKQVAEESVRRLKDAYPDAICSLESTQPHELLIATRLSAQCTDARVNIVTQVLFDKYRTIHDFAVADLADVEAIVHPCGLYKTKARDIIAMCQMLERDFHSTVPDEMESLLKTAGNRPKDSKFGAGGRLWQTCCGLRYPLYSGLPTASADRYQGSSEMRNAAAPAATAGRIQ